MAETKLYHIHRFNGSNYQLWKRQMEIYMADNGLKKYIDGSTPKPTAAADLPAWEKKDAEAQTFLMRGFELDQLRYMTDCTTAAAMWARLRTIHAEKSDQSVQRLKDIDMEQKEEVVIAKIISSLPEKYDNVRTAWYAVPRIDQKLEKLTDHLVNEESLLNIRERRNDVTPSSEQEAKNSLYLNIADCVENIDKNQFIIGKPLETIDNFYSYPSDSRTLNIKVVKYSNENLQSNTN
ncbi:hypothetical protein TSAR_009755 [Trichomalopsis sarcophagae]|uniref:DUF4219 domain-containing protein n=1 Tax=Trichomalopsis sarcophagae TaxID=543379 RepID=A0A232EHA4_9HYME|nr:hypothetical protein TSAR_009755 [Trichomalopsis sarcophagae]